MYLLTYECNKWLLNVCNIQPHGILFFVILYFVFLAGGLYVEIKIWMDYWHCIPFTNLKTLLLPDLIMANERHIAILGYPGVIPLDVASGITPGYPRMAYSRQASEMVWQCSRLHRNTAVQCLPYMTKCAGNTTKRPWRDRELSDDENNFAKNDPTVWTAFTEKWQKAD